MQQISPEHQPETSVKFGYHPELDGIRAFAVLFVIVFHLGIPQFQGGFLGVDLFFVLSGFLITSLLLEEWETTKTINFKNFYIRRGLRLIPGLLFFLFVIILLNLIFDYENVAEILKVALTILLYFANWSWVLNIDLGMFAHTWSLSVEEQFYILFPAFLFILLRLKRKWLIFGTLSVLIAAVNIWREYLSYVGFQKGTMGYNGLGFMHVYHGSDTHSDGILFGCLLAVVLFYKLFPKIISSISNLSVFILSVTLCLIMNFWAFSHSPKVYYGGFLLFNICSVLMVNYLISPFAAKFIYSLFTLQPLLWIGKRSYGLYLWHYPCVFVLDRILPADLPRIYYYMSVFVFSFMAVSISFYYIEQPCLRLKKQFTDKKFKIRSEIIVLGLNAQTAE